MEPPSEFLPVILQFLQKLFDMFYNLAFYFLMTTGGVQVEEFDDGLIDALWVLTPFLQGADEAVFLEFQAEGPSCAGTLDDRTEVGQFFQ